MKYLFIGAHTDDIELSCGGSIIKLTSDGHDVEYICLSNCTNDVLRGEFYESSELLGCSRYLYDFTARDFESERPQFANYFYNLRSGYDLIFAHSIMDKHPDHRSVAEECKRIFNGNLITYIGPWNGTEDSNYFIELSEEHLEKKIAALACYKSQSHRPYMSPDFIRSQAIYNGIKCGKRYAEAFRIEKLIN